MVQHIGGLSLTICGLSCWLPRSVCLPMSLVIVIHYQSKTALGMVLRSDPMRLHLIPPSLIAVTEPGLWLQYLPTVETACLPCRLRLRDCDWIMGYYVTRKCAFSLALNVSNLYSAVQSSVGKLFYTEGLYAGKAPDLDPMTMFLNPVAPHKFSTVVSW